MSLPSIRRAVRVKSVRLGILCLLLGLGMEFLVPQSLPGNTIDGNQRDAETHVLMINGGGSRQSNYQSHLLHIKKLYELLLRTGVPADRVTIMNADGADRAADLAVREVQPEKDFWLLSGTHLEKPLRTQIAYENSEVGAVSLQPATRASLRRWFGTAKQRLQPGDTLFFYVTDHGTRGKDDPSENKITLWGKEEHLSVRELRELLGSLDPGVRVVMLMSQCYSGAFGDLMYRPGDNLPRGNIAGFFSTTGNRRAYGCYPENRDKDNVGHSFRFIEALGAARNLAEAHRQVLVNDHTPDVPLKTSDLYLEDRLEEEARRSGENLDASVDQLLALAWRDKETWEPEIRLLDRMGETFGYFSPRLLAELAEQAEQLSQVGRDLGSYNDVWTAALRSLNREILRRFQADNPQWDSRLSKEALDSLRGADRRVVARELLKELADYARKDPETAARLALLREKAEATREASYRMEVRQGVVLRMRYVLMSIAGRACLNRSGTVAERLSFQRLIQSEAFAPAARDELPGLQVLTEPFPSYDEDLRLAEAALPGWMGIRFRPVSEERREKSRLAAGAVSVLTVYPDSPAMETGLEQGDIILGPASAPFAEPERIREWIMTAPIGEPQRLLVQRGTEQFAADIIPQPYPRKWPKLPGPPGIGKPAPPVPHLQALRGTLPVELAKGGGGGPFMLFFWATWCGPCKAALPEVTAFERERNVPVIAISDELPEKVETFFQKYRGPFPALAAVDEFRRSFVAYGVSGTPSFVLVDAAGRIQSMSTGYRADKGLEITGWSWTRPSAQP